MPRKDMQSFVIPLCRRLSGEMGYTLVDAELVKEGPGRYLRIYLDKEGGVDLNDCERFHRQVQPLLEPVDYDFLEVSSPGIDRPLKTDRDFERALGAEVEVKLYKPVDGRKAFEGVLVGWDTDTLRIQSGGDEQTFPRREAALVKPIIRFDDTEFDEGEREP